MSPILIRRGLAIDIVDKGTDPQGRVAWILADIYSKKLLIIGVYGPSSGDDDVFLQDRVFSILDVLSSTTMLCSAVTGMSAWTRTWIIGIMVSQGVPKAAVNYIAIFKNIT